MKCFTATFAVFVFSVASCGSAQAQQGDLTGLGQFQRVLILPDTSGSLDAREFSGVMTALQRNLTDVVRAVGAEEVGLLPWASSTDALRSAAWVSVPRRHAETPLTIQFTEGESIFRGAHELRIRREAEIREARAAEAEREDTRRLAEALTPLMVRLGSVRQGKATCTDVRGILERCARERPGTLCVLITDGEDECTAGDSRLDNLPATSQLVVILTPTHRASAATDMDARVRWLHQMAPWARIVFSFQVSGGIDRWLAPVQAQSGSGVAERLPGLR